MGPHGHPPPQGPPVRRPRLPQDWRARIVDRAPLPLLTHAHEVGLSIALLVIALPLLGGDPAPPSIHSQVPEAMATFWAWALVGGSVLTIWGLFANRPRVEWGGQLWLGYALTFYALALVWGAGAAGFLASAVFGVLGLVSWWRAFKITSAAQVQHRLVQAARHAHETATVERTIRRNREGGRP